MRVLAPSAQSLAALPYPWLGARIHSLQAMRHLEIRADGVDAEQVREWQRRPGRLRYVALSAGALVAVLYATNNPGEFRIQSSVTDATTTERFVDISGDIENPAIQTVALDVNGSYRSASVTGGRFTSRVPLVRGPNTIRASVGGVASLLTRGSNVITILGNVPASDIWSELTWDGPGDIDLHLYLPNGEHCYYKNSRTSLGAFLDFDNTARDGPEHIVMDKAAAGRYRMTVLYYAAADAIKSPVRWSVKLRLHDGAITQDYSGVLTAVNEETEFWSTDWKAE